MADYRTVTVTASISPLTILASANLSKNAVDAIATVPIEVHFGGAQPYEGSYIITPTREAQALQTQAKNMLNNIIVNPIPSNYGLITWDGSVMTVS